MGGTRFNNRGIDDEGNTANYVETEQMLIKTKVNRDKLTKKVYTYSYSQVRGTAPLYWTQSDGKVRIERSIESTIEVFLKHAENLMNDYESDNFLIANLLA